MQASKLAYAQTGAAKDVPRVGNFGLTQQAVMSARHQAELDSAHTVETVEMQASPYTECLQEPFRRPQPYLFPKSVNLRVRNPPDGPTSGP